MKGLALALLAFAPVAQAASPVARAIVVERSGWVRVALDAPAIVMAPDDGYRVLDPAGHAVAARRVIGNIGPRGAGGLQKVKDVHEEPAGWVITFDTGIEPAYYDRLDLVLNAPFTATGAALEGSRDGRTWTELARGNLFSLAGSTPHQASVPFAPDTWRYLRLHWPRAAGVPGIERIGAFAGRWAGPLAGPVPLAVEAGSACEPLTLTLPAPRLPLARIDVPGALEGAHTLRVAEDGRWVDVHATSTTGTFELGGARFGSGALRVDGNVRANAGGAAAWLEPRWLYFNAASAGTYRLVAAAPNDPDAAKPDAPIDPDPALVSDVALGPALALAPAPFDENVTRLARVDQMPRHWASWALHADGMKPGDVVRAELPSAMFDVPGIGPDNVRPIADDGVVPFVIEPLARPALDRRVPERKGDVYTIELPLGGVVPRQLELRLKSAVTRPVEATVQYRVVTRPGVPPVTRPAGSVRFVSVCRDGASALLDLAPPAGANELDVTLRAELGSPPELGEAWYWSPRDALVFRWPASKGPVRLATGFDPVPDNAPQVIAVREQLRGRDAISVTVDVERTHAESDRLAKNSKVALIASLVVTSLVLTLILGRALVKKA